MHDSQFEVTSTRAEPRVSPPCELSVEGTEVPFLREDHDAVGLPQAEVQPGSIGAIALQDRELGSRFAVGEPIHETLVSDVPSALQRPVHGSASVLEGQAGRDAGPREGIHELIAHALHVCPAGSQHRNGAREVVRRAGKGRNDLRRAEDVDEVCGDDACEVEQDVRVLDGDCAELLGRKAEQLAVPDGMHVERRAAAAQDESFAHGRAPEVLEHDVAPAVRVDVRGAQPTPSDQDEGDAGLTALDDARPPRHVDHLKGLVQVFQRPRIEAATDGPPGEQMLALNR